MKKSTAFIFIIIALIVGFKFGSITNRRVPDSTRSYVDMTPIPTLNAYSSTKKSVHDYIANKKTKKFHKPTCSSVRQMNESNKKYYYSVTRQSMIDEGYSPCGRCDP